MNLNPIKYMVLGGIVFSFLTLSANAYAYPQEEKEGKFKERWEKRKGEIYKKLDLTEEQQKQLKENREKNHAQAEELSKQIKTKREELSTELQKDDFDVGKVKAIHNDLKALKAQKEDMRLDGILAVRNILTPEQFHKFMDLKDDFKEKRKKHNRRGYGKDRSMKDGKD